MSVDGRAASARKKNFMLDDIINNDSSSGSACSSNNEGSQDSCSNVGTVVKKISPSAFVGSDDSSQKILEVSDLSNDKVRNKLGNKLNERRKLESTSRENKPLFSISFRNREVARKYKSHLRTFFKELILKHDPDTEEEDLSDLELDIWEEANEDSEEVEIVDDSSLFQIDTRPTIKDDLDIPTYNQKFSEILKKQNKDENKTDVVEGPSRNSCFNCLENHSLRDCPHPKDPAAIARNRRVFVTRHGSTPNKSSRYHLDEEQKFSGFVPGQISNKLTKALGLGKHHMPKHIYKMRLLGYPPGWLEDAKISHSGLALYDSQGKEVADPDAEEGEIFTEGSRDKFDIRKIISYPGFNVPCSPGTTDDYEYHNCPPMNFEQSKERMLAELGQNSVRAYKRRRLTQTPKARKQNDQDLTHTDMDVEDTAGEAAVNLLPPDDDCRFIPPLPKDTPPRPPPPPSTESDSEGGESRSQGIGSPLSTEQSGMSSPRAQSPSLSDLETRKQLLLAELEDGGSSSDTTQKAARSGTPEPSVSNLGKVKSVALGTPVLESASPFSRLPNAEKFQRDICDVINFENLPDSTGKYEQMSDLIKKVRTVVTRIQQEEDDDDSGGK